MKVKLASPIDPKKHSSNQFQPYGDQIEAEEAVKKQSIEKLGKPLNASQNRFGESMQSSNTVGSLNRGAYGTAMAMNAKDIDGLLGRNQYKGHHKINSFAS